MKRSTPYFMLRYTLLPDETRSERIRELVEFCRETGVQEVVFFINAEEFNDGHLTAEETRVWLEAIEEAKEKLEEIGVLTSLNPWHTLLHADRGRRLKPDQDFQLMVDPYGNTSSCCVCPLCPNWRKYIAEIFRLYASIKPNIIFVDDDFRYHNHAPLKWGGCFCDLHLEEMGRRIGRGITREELVEAILKPGKPHPYRRVWLNLLHEGLTSLARTLREAVKSVSSSTKLGLMCSDPTVHAAEGRRWRELLKALCGDDPVIVRPHAGPYSEASPPRWHDAFALLMHTLALLPKGAQAYPEIENFPYTRFSKSVAQTRLQITLSLAAGSRGVMLNLFDFMGNGVSTEPKYREMLVSGRNYWGALARECWGEGEVEGVKVVFSPESSLHARTEEGKRMEELYTQDRGWAVHLSALGVSYSFAAPGDIGPEDIAAVSGKVVYSFSDDEAVRLLSSNLLLDGQAIYSLAEMGYGELVGVEDVEWIWQQEAAYSYEEAVDGEFMPRGVRLTAQMAAPDRLLHYRLKDSCRVITEIRNARGEKVANGMYLFENKLGGKIVGLPYILPNRFITGFLNYFRQRQIQNGIRWLRGNMESEVLMVEGEPYVLPVRVDFEEKSLVCFFNLTSDAIQEIVFETGGIDLSRPLILNEKGEWVSAEIKVLKEEENGNSRRILLRARIMPQNQAVLKLAKA